MFRFLFFFLKISLFSLAVLILGNWITIGGNTISDQIKAQMSQAERSTALKKVRQTSRELLRDVKDGSSEITDRITETDQRKLERLLNELTND